MAQKIDPQAIASNLAEGKTYSSALDVRRQNGQTDRESGRGKAAALAAKLWVLMGEAYGYKWASQFGESPTDTWVGALNGITGEQIAAALRKCSESYPQWPPAAIEFRALCEGRDPRNFDRDGIDSTYQHKLIERADRERREQIERNRHLRLTDQNYEEKNREAGAATLDSLKSLF